MLIYISLCMKVFIYIALFTHKAILIYRMQNNVVFLIKIKNIHELINWFSLNNFFEIMKQIEVFVV